MNRWIPVTKKLPKLGESVEVRGEYATLLTGLRFGFPHARRVRIDKFHPSGWESREWRGMVGITHWRRIQKKEKR